MLHSWNSADDEAQHPEDPDGVDGVVSEFSSAQRVPDKAAPFLRNRTSDLCPNAKSDTGFVPIAKCIAYGAPDLGKAPIQLLISVHVLSFYQGLGAGLGVLAFFTSVARCFDVLTDPIMANVTDATRTRWGRRRPYITIGCFFYGLLFACLCSPPDGHSESVGLWFGMFYVLFFLADTLTNVPHNALGQEVTTNPDQRRKLFMVAKLFEAVGTLLAAVLPALLTMAFNGGCELPSQCSSAAVSVDCQRLGGIEVCNTQPSGVCQWLAPQTSPASEASCENLCIRADLICGDAYQSSNRQAMQTVGIIFGVWTVGSMLLCVAAIRERTLGPRAVDMEARTVTVSAGAAGPLLDQQAAAEQLPEAPSKVEEVLPNFLSMMKNRPFRAMIIPWVLDQTLVAIVASMLPFFVTYVVSPERMCLKPPTLPETSFICSDLNLMSVGLVGLLLAAILSLPVWLAIARQVGDYKAWVGFNCMNAMTNILFVFPGFYWPDRTLLVVTIVIFACLNGVPMGAKFLSDNILGLCIDYDELRTGARNEAAFTMFASFIPKVVSVPASSFPLTMLALTGFKEPEMPDGGPNIYQGELVLWTIRTMFGVVPFCLALLSCFLKWYLFPLRDMKTADAQIKAGLLLRREGCPYRDPLTQEFVVPAQPAQPAWRRAIALLNHFPEMECVCRVKAESPEHRGSYLVLRTGRQTICTLIATLAFVIGTILSMQAGFLNQSSRAWIPSLLVVLVGVGLLCLIISLLRLSAARTLRHMSLSDELLDVAIADRRQITEGDMARARVDLAHDVALAFKKINEEAAKADHHF